MRCHGNTKRSPVVCTLRPQPILHTKFWRLGCDYGTHQRAFAYSCQIGFKASTDGGATWSGSYITNGNGPANDPGGTQDWMFKIVATVASTSGTTDSVARLRVTASDGVGTQATSPIGTNPDATITRYGAEGFTQVGEKSNGPWSNDVQINLGWQQGSTNEVYVNSNEHWEVTIE